MADTPSIVAMPMLSVTCFTDPMCPWSWAAEPAARALESRFDGEVAITYVMGGLARTIEDAGKLLRSTLDGAAFSGMPADARVWLERPPRSTHPACLAVKAAAEQGLDGAYLRRAREAVFTARRPCDSAEALLDVAREVPGLDAARFEVDLRSNAIVETFGADVERARQDGERVPLPTFVLRGDGGEERVDGEVAPEALLAAAARAAGREPGPAPTVEAALRRFGRMATAEVAAVCGLRGPRAPAELWAAAVDFTVRAEPVPGGGELWSLTA